LGVEDRGKRVGRVGKIKAELAVNHRLSSAYHVCEKLGIDDPVCWLNNTKPEVLDGWVAWFSHMADVREGKVKTQMSPNDAENYLSGMVK